MNKAGALHTVEGSSATRRSPRTYTHAVVADYDHASSIKSNVEWTTRQAADLWDYDSEVAKKNAGDALIGGGSFSGKPFTYSADDVAKARAFIAANPDRADYIVGCVAETVARIKSTADGTLLVLQWSMSERSAIKAIGTWAKRSGYRNVRVVPVMRKG